MLTVHVMTTFRRFHLVSALTCWGGHPTFSILPQRLNIDRYNVAPRLPDVPRTVQGTDQSVRHGPLLSEYSVPIDRTLFMFTSGRYEPRNKALIFALSRWQG